MSEFTDRARTEAEKRWHPTIRSGINQPPFGPTDYLDEGMASGFVLGALWAAEQEPTEEETTVLNDRLADILTRTANALNGDPSQIGEHGGAWSWHDLPEKATAALALANTHREVAESMTKQWHAERIRADRLKERLTADPTEEEIQAAARALLDELGGTPDELESMHVEAACAALLAARDVRKEQGR